MLDENGHPASIRDLLRQGSTHEDAGFWRAQNHFFNPINNQGLFWEVPMMPDFAGFPNRDWAMGVGPGGVEYDACGPGDHFSSATCNDYSWRRVKQSFYEALGGTKGTSIKL